MIRYFVVSIVNGVVFGMLDGLINANPYAQRLFAVYEPIAKKEINVPAGIVIDVFYGLVMGFIFLLLHRALPGNSGLVKGISFGLTAWFFRVLMSVMTTWMMFDVPIETNAYVAITGLFEMLIIGMIFGVFLRPFSF